MPPEFLDRGAFLVGGHRLAVPPLLVGEERDAVALLGPRDDQRGLVGGTGLRVGRIDRGDVVAVDLDRVPAEGLRTLGEQVGTPLVHRGAALAEPVEVEDADEVVHLMEGGGVHGLPDRTLGDLGVTHQHPRAGWQAVEPHRQRHAQAHREALTERAARHIDPGELGHRGGMPLDRRPELAKRHQLLVVDRADRLQHRVQRRGGVTLRHDEAVVGRGLGIADVEAEVVGVQHGEQVGARHGRGGMAGARAGGAADAVHRDLCRQVVPQLDSIVHGSPRRSWSGPVRPSVPPSGLTRGPAIAGRVTSSLRRGLRALRTGTLDGV